MFHFLQSPFSLIRHSKKIRESRETLVIHIATYPTNRHHSVVSFLCGVAQCKTCKFVDCFTAISAPKFTYHDNFTCTSIHLINCISCSGCGMRYIAETGRQLRTRFGEHRRAFADKDATKPVARLFNSGSHSIFDMKPCFISGTNDGCKRHEMRPISKLATVHRLGSYASRIGFK